MNIVAKIGGVFFVLVGLVNVYAAVTDGPFYRIFINLFVVLVGIMLFIAPKIAKKSIVNSNAPVPGNESKNVSSTNSGKEQSYSVTAFLLKNMLNIGSKRGMLEVNNKSVTFKTEAGNMVMNIPLQTVNYTNKQFPLAYLQISDGSSKYKYVFTGPVEVAIQSGFIGKEFTNYLEKMRLAAKS
ncbi:hypothetical protein HY857_00355 [Candidatus Saccharibacteria bacterium]|nr:hypothetical protein [Candidatus Saccharibacteria bacterium]